MSSTTASARLDSNPVVVARLGLIGYLEAWERQRELAAERADGIGADTLLLLEHPPPCTPRAGAPRTATVPPTALR